jgi:hypothetical protein
MRQSLEARYRGVTPIVFGAKKQILSGFADDVVNKEKGPAAFVSAYAVDGYFYHALI